MSQNYIRPQNLLRSWFGLGPSQLEAGEFIHPTIDVGWLSTSLQEQQILSQQLGPIAPGAGSTATLSWPKKGYWLVDWITAYTSGPATSGFTRMQIFALLTRGPVAGSFTLGAPDFVQQLPDRGSLFNAVGYRFNPPMVMFALPGINDDVFQIEGQNDTTSVGNADFFINVLCRQLELVKE